MTVAEGSKLNEHGCLNLSTPQSCRVYKGEDTIRKSDVPATKWCGMDSMSDGVCEFLLAWTVKRKIGMPKTTRSRDHAAHWKLGVAWTSWSVEPSYQKIKSISEIVLCVISLWWLFLIEKRNVKPGGRPLDPNVSRSPSANQCFNSDFVSHVIQLLYSISWKLLSGG